MYRRPREPSPFTSGEMEICSGGCTRFLTLYGHPPCNEVFFPQPRCTNGNYLDSGDPPSLFPLTLIFIGFLSRRTFAMKEMNMHPLRQLLRCPLLPQSPFHCLLHFLPQRVFEKGRVFSFRFVMHLAGYFQLFPPHPAARTSEELPVDSPRHPSFVPATPSDSAGLFAACLELVFPRIPEVSPSTSIALEVVSPCTPIPGPPTSPSTASFSTSPYSSWFSKPDSFFPIP